ncbi:MAG: PH domain-containing protein [Chloroflexia bacterium]|nr:PH domain-containing protein [Chloroflexia bacterium]
MGRFNLELAAGEELRFVYPRHWIVFARRTWWLALVLGLLLIIGRWLIARLIEDSGEALAPTILLTAILAAASILLLFFYLDWRNDALIYTNRRLVHVERVVLIFKSQEEVTLDKVQDVNTTVRGLFAQLLGYGDIYIDTAARGTDIRFGPIARPRDAQQEVMATVRGLQAKASAKLMQQTLLHRMDPDRYPEPSLPRATAPEMPVRRRWRLLEWIWPPNPRREGDEITWYKHNIFLLQRMLVPTLLLILVAAGAFFFPPWADASALWIGWGLLLLLLVGVLVVNYQLWLGDIYVLRSDMLLDIKRTPFGLFGESRRAGGLGRIQNIMLEQPGFMANLFNFGNVRIQTAGQEDFTFNRVPRPEEVQREIDRRQALYRLRQEQREREGIADWVVTFWQMTQEPPEQ